MAVDSLQSAQPADSVGRPLTEKELKKLGDGPSPL